MVTPSSQKLFLVEKNPIFLFFKSAQVFVLPVRAVVSIIALVCAQTRAVRVLKDPGFFLPLLLTTFLYSFARLLVDSYLTEEVKLKVEQVDQKRTDKQVDQKKKHNAITTISIPNLNQVICLSFSLSTGFSAIRSVAVLWQEIVTEQKKKKKDPS